MKYSTSFLVTLLAGGSVLGTASAALALKAEMQVDSLGVFLEQVVNPMAGEELPRVKLSSAPVCGKRLILTRAQITGALLKMAPDLATNNWSGAEQIIVTRRTRTLEESELKELLTTELQHAAVRERGELELRFGRAWIPVVIPDEPFVLKILELPTAGITPNFIARFELRAGLESLGLWQLPVQARVMREIWVAGAMLPRGQSLRDAELTQEKRDLLTLRDSIIALPAGHEAMELAENVSAGAPLTARSLRMRPVIRRGKIVEALVQEGALVISVKVEALEDGVPGQTVRVRNPQSKREFRGKVKNEETILISI